MKTQRDQWFKEVVAAYEPRLLRYLFRMVPHAVAREITQDTFLKLLNEDDQTIRNRIAEWLFTVCRNSARDFIRKERFIESRVNDLVVVDPGPLPSQEMEERQQLDLVNRSILKLTVVEQEVVRLKFQEGFSYKEINRITGHSVSYVGVLIYQSIQKIRKDLCLTGGVKNETGT